MPNIITKFERAKAEDVTALAKFGSATIHEAQGRLGALSSRLKPIDRTMSLCGPAFTVQSAPATTSCCSSPFTMPNRAT